MVLCYIVLYYINYINYIVLYCIILYHIVLYCNILHYYIISHYIILYHITLYHSILYYIISYYIMYICKYYVYCINIYMCVHVRSVGLLAVTRLEESTRWNGVLDLDGHVPPMAESSQKMIDLYDLIIGRSNLLIRKYMLIIYVLKNGKTHHYYYYYIYIYIYMHYKHIYIYTIVNIWTSPYYMAIPISFKAHLNLGRTCQDDPRDIREIRQVLQFSTL